MANIEVSLSSSNLGRRRKISNTSGSIHSLTTATNAGSYINNIETASISRSLPPSRSETKEIKTKLQGKELFVQSLRTQLCLNKLPRQTESYLEKSERPASEQTLLRLKTDAENKRIAIRNLKSALGKLDITDNIDVRIRQAELEYALGREELQLLSIVEEARALQSRLDKSKPELNSLYSILKTGVSLSLHAVQTTVGRWAAHQKSDSPGLYVEWALDGEGLFQGDRIIEVNGKIVNQRTGEELQKTIATGSKCQLVVVRKKTSTIPHQQLIQQQEDNMRLQHRISYLEEQVRELQISKESSCRSPYNGGSEHVTSINISSSSLSSSSAASKSQSKHQQPLSQILSTQNKNQSQKHHQLDNYATTIIDGKPIELHEYPQKSHITRTIIKDNGSLTDTECSSNFLIPITKSFSTSKISVSNEYQTNLNLSSYDKYTHRDRDRYEPQTEKTTTLRSHIKFNPDVNPQNTQSHDYQYYRHNSQRSSHDYARSTEYLSDNRVQRKKNVDPTSHSILKFQKKLGNDSRSVCSLHFDSEMNNEKKHKIDYTSEPVNNGKYRPTPPKKPLRLSLQRAQSLQTVELHHIIPTPAFILSTADLDKKRGLKRAHTSAEKSTSTLSFLQESPSVNPNLSNDNCVSNPLHTSSLGRQKHNI